MSANGLKKISGFVILVLIQVLVLNKVNIFGYATPFLYIYLIVSLGISTPRWQGLLIGFALGLCIDFFTHTPGINASATVLLAFLQPVFLRLFAPRDSDETLCPTMNQLGLMSFLKYALLCVLVHHTMLFMLEYFTYVGLVQTLLKIGGSTVLTISLIVAVDKMTD